MSAQKPLNIALLTSDQGHWSIAQAVRESLVPHHHVELFHDRIIFQEVYRLFYRHSPQLFKYIFKSGENPLVEQSNYVVARLYYQQKIAEFFQGKTFDLIITSYAYFLPTLTQYEALPPIINVLSDPRTITPIFIGSPPVINLSFDEVANTVVKEYKADARLHTTGWFVTGDFEKKYQPKAAKKRLGLDVNVPVFLVVAGSEGQMSVLKIIKGLLTSPQPLQLIVVSGSNARLRFDVDQLFTQFASQSKTTHLNIGFTDELAKYMQAADLVIGKAGPNTLFEAVATHTPFFATSHIHGQEDGNLDIIRDYQLGYVEEEAKKALEKLRRLAKDPSPLQKFQPHLKQVAEYNRQAKVKLLELIPQLVTGHQPVTFP